MYELDAFDLSLVTAARQLLTKLMHADALLPAQLVTVAKVQHVLSRLPRLSEAMEITVQVTGPRRQFEDIETYHWWTLRIEDHAIGISSGGYFFRPSTGGDTFSTMAWVAQPGEWAEFSDYIDGLGIVPDVQPFPDAVRSMDFAAFTYEIEVTDPENTLLDDTDEDEDEDEVDEVDDEDEEEEEAEEEPPLQVVPVDAKGWTLAELVDFSVANRRKPDYAYGIKSCDLCQCSLAEVGLFVDGALRGQAGWANMCPSCFEKHGHSIGWGKGQIYARQSNGRWRLVAGFQPR